MDVAVDLHSHSGASGGVGDISLAAVAATMGRKGIAVFGTGDAFHDAWLAQLDDCLVPAEPGLYRLETEDVGGPRFLVQSEIILTAPVPSGGRKGVHLVVLLPDVAAARAVSTVLDGWGVKRRIGRPFMTCDSADEVAARCHALQRVDPGIELVPAHVLTPQGIFGSDHPVDRLADFFGEGEELIRVVETGLSADPAVLALIPELDGRTLLSSSDCHSGALNRVGREYTVLELAALSYEEIVAALRQGRVVTTAEFSPAEGRYFLTGHRAGKRGHKDGQYCYFSPDRTPADGRCPICGKALTVGVLERALALSAVQGDARSLETVEPRQPFFHMVPLVELLATALGIRSPSSKKVLALYDAVLAEVGTEAVFWRLTDAEAASLCAALGRPEVEEAIARVRAGEYTFWPLGYDGTYGELVLGETGTWMGHSEIYGETHYVSAPEVQGKLL